MRTVGSIFAFVLGGVASAYAAEGDFAIEPLLEGRFRPEQYTLLRVTGPISADPDNPALRIVVRPVDSPDSIEFSARTETVRGGKVAAVVPVVFFSPAPPAKLRVSTRDERNRVLAEADVEVGKPGLNALAGADRLAVAITARPEALLGALRSSGRTMGLRLETVALAPEDLPANHAGLDSADLVILDLAVYANLVNERQDLLRSWCLTHRNPDIDAAFGGTLLLFDPTGAAGSVDRKLWQPVGAGGGTALWAMVGVFERGTQPLDLQLEVDRRPLPEPTSANRPRFSDNERRIMAAGCLGFVIAVAAVGLFTARPGRGGFGASLLAAASLLFAGLLVWVLPGRASARLDVLEVVEYIPLRPGEADCAARRLFYLGAAGMRETEAVVSTVRAEALLPVFEDPGGPTRVPLRIETRPDGRQDITFRCRSVSRPGRLEDNPRGGFSRTPRRFMPMYGLVGFEARVEAVPLELSARSDGRTLVVRTGAGWSMRLTDCVIIDAPGAHSASLAARVAGREKARAPESRVIPVDNFERGPNPELFVDLLTDKAVTFADLVRLSPADDELARIRKSVLRTAAGDDKGACRLNGPYLVGWADLPTQSVVGSLPAGLNAAEPGRLVFIRLDGLFKAAGPPGPQRP